MNSESVSDIQKDLEACCDDLMLSWTDSYARQFDRKHLEVLRECLERLGGNVDEYKEHTKDFKSIIEHAKQFAENDDTQDVY